jgi:NAD(P)-dependent dehydrogenase (short-subunit alcohol dehydrogenase family)
MTDRSAAFAAVAVTGGSGGLGGAVCAELARHDLLPIVGYWRNEQDAARVAAGSGGIAARMDLRHPAEALASLRAALAGRSLAAVVLAGAEAPRVEPFSKLDPAALRARLELDVFGTSQFLTGVVREHFAKPGKGTVVGVLSDAMGGGQAAASPALAGYVIGKYALAGVLAALAAEFSWLVVRTVNPGFLDTAMLKAFDPRFVSGLRAAGRIGDPAEWARKIVAEIGRAPAA